MKKLLVVFFTLLVACSSEMTPRAYLESTHEQRKMWIKDVLLKAKSAQCTYDDSGKELCKYVFDDACRDAIEHIGLEATTRLVTARINPKFNDTLFSQAEKAIAWEVEACYMHDPILVDIKCQGRDPLKCR